MLMRTFRWRRWIVRTQQAIAIVMIASLPVTACDPDVARLYNSIPALGCARVVSPVDRAGTLEALKHAYAWNDLLDKRFAAVNYNYFSAEQVLTMVSDWSPQIVCIAAEFDIPPELLAGIMASELDLDYHVVDAVFDDLVMSPFGDTFSHVEVGAAYAGVHFAHLKPALAALGDAYCVARPPISQSWRRAIACSISQTRRSWPDIMRCCGSVPVPFTA